MRTKIIPALIATQLSACTFDLGNATPPAGASELQMKLDILECKDKVKIEQSGTGKQIGEFFLSMTIVGYPAAIAIDRSVARSTYAKCMTAKGYTVTLDDKVSKPTGQSTPLKLEPNTPSTKLTTNLSIDAGEGWQDQEYPPNGVKNIVRYETNKTIDAGVMLFSEPKSGITDFAQYAKTKSAQQASKLKDPKLSAISKIKVNDRNAYRFEVRGVAGDGIDVTFIATLIEGNTEIALVYAWSLTSNMNNVRPTLTALSEKVKGL